MLFNPDTPLRLTFSSVKHIISYAIQVRFGTLQTPHCLPIKPMIVCEVPVRCGYCLMLLTMSAWWSTYLLDCKQICPLSCLCDPSQSGPSEPLSTPASALSSHAQVIQTSCIRHSWSEHLVTRCLWFGINATKLWSLHTSGNSNVVLPRTVCYPLDTHTNHCIAARQIAVKWFFERPSSVLDSLQCCEN